MFTFMWWVALPLSMTAFRNFCPLNTGSQTFDLFLIVFVALYHLQLYKSLHKTSKWYCKWLKKLEMKLHISISVIGCHPKAANTRVTKGKSFRMTTQFSILGMIGNTGTRLVFSMLSPYQICEIAFICSDRHFSIYVVHHKFIFVSLYPHGKCWLTVNFKFKKSFFGVQRNAKSRVPSWNKQWMINIHSKSLHEEVCILISISVVLNIHTYMCVCPVCLVHVLTNSGENIGRYTGCIYERQGVLRATVVKLFVQSFLTTYPAFCLVFTIRVLFSCEWWDKYCKNMK